MKLIYFNDFRLGVLKGDTVVDVTSVVQKIPHTDPGDLMNGLIARFDEFRGPLEKAAAAGTGLPVSQVRYVRRCPSRSTSTAWRSTTWKTARARRRRRSTRSTSRRAASSVTATPWCCRTCRDDLRRRGGTRAGDRQAREQRARRESDGLHFRLREFHRRFRARRLRRPAYNLAQLTWRDHPQEALDQLAKALRLAPGMAEAHIDLAWLLNRLGRTAEAIPHFLKAIEISPRDIRALDQLGAAYITLDRPADAEKVLRRAISISPDNPEAVMHLGRALMELGREGEARQFLDQFQKIRPARVRGPWKQPGMIESAILAPAERSKREIERLRRDAGTHPDDPELQFRLASLLLTEGSVEQATSEFRTLLTLNAESRIWHQAGSLLLGFEQYALAKEFLLRATVQTPAANLDLAVAIFFLEGSATALSTLEQVPETGTVRRLPAVEGPDPGRGGSGRRSRKSSRAGAPALHFPSADCPSGRAPAGAPRPQGSGTRPHFQSGWKRPGSVAHPGNRAGFDGAQRRRRESPERRRIPVAGMGPALPGSRTAVGALAARRSATQTPDRRGARFKRPRPALCGGASDSDRSSRSAMLLRERPL